MTRAWPAELIFVSVLKLRSLQIEVAARAAFAVAVPLLLLYYADRMDWAAYASFGAMTALYGRGEPYRTRAKTVTVGGVGLFSSIAFGMLMARVSAPLWLLSLGLVAVLVVGILVAAMAGLFPPTPIFFVFAYSVCAQVPTPASEVGERLLLAFSAAAFAWLVTMSGWMLRLIAQTRKSAAFAPHPRSPSLRIGAWHDAAVWLVVGQNVIGGLVAGGLGIFFGIGHPYWAVVAVIAVVPPPHAPPSITRAFHRIIGTAIGVVITALILFREPPIIVIILVVVIGQFGAEILVGRMYGAAMLFITPLALGVAHLASTQPVPQLLADRFIETAVGAVIGILMVLLGVWVKKRRSSARFHVFGRS